MSGTDELPKGLIEGNKSSKKIGSWVTTLAISVLILVPSYILLEFYGIPISYYGPYLAFIVFILMIKVIVPDDLSSMFNIINKSYPETKVALDPETKVALDPKPQYAYINNPGTINTYLQQDPTALGEIDNDNETWTDVLGEESDDDPNAV